MLVSSVAGNVTEVLVLLENNKVDFWELQCYYVLHELSLTVGLMTFLFT